MTDPRKRPYDAIGSDFMTSSSFSGEDLTLDQLEHMHVKGKLKKYSRMEAQHSQNEGGMLSHNISESETDSDSDNDANKIHDIVDPNIGHYHSDGLSPDFDMSLSAQGRSLEQYRSEIAIRIERERLRLEAELQSERARLERRRAMDSAMIQKDEILIQFCANQFEVAQILIRNTQVLVEKLAAQNNILKDDSRL